MAYTTLFSSDSGCCMANIKKVHYVRGLAKVGRVYHYRFSIRGRVFHGSTFCESRETAAQWLRVFRDEIALNSKGIHRAPTLEALLSQWEGAVTHVLSAAHVSRVVRQIQKHFRNLMATPIDRLSSADVQAVITNYMATEGATVSRNGESIRRPHTAGGVKALMCRLDGVMGYAIKMRLIQAIPYTVIMPAVQERGRPILMPEQVVPFLRVIDTSRNPHIHLAVRLMLGLGLRAGETLRCEWSWFQLGTGVYCGEGKTRTAKALPIPGWLLEFLRALPGDKTAGLLMPSKEDPALPHADQFTTKAIRRAGKAVGVPLLSPHGLRATFATIHHVWAKATVTETQQLCGHGQASTTTRHYIQRHAPGLRDAQERFGEVTGLTKEHSICNTPFDYQI